MPAPQTYTIETSTNGTTWTALSDVRSINAQIGRTRFADAYAPSSLNFTIGYSSGFASPNAALVTGTLVRLKRTGGAYLMWMGRIADVSVDYGIPYAGSVGVEDTATISCEGALAIWGRLQGNGVLAPAGAIRSTIGTAIFGTNLLYGTTYTADDDPTVEASNVNGSYLEWVNTVATTLGTIVKDGTDSVDTIGLYSKNYANTIATQFSDTTNNSSNQQYSQVKLTSQVENYFTQVTVTTQFNGTAIASSGSAPYRTLPLSTINSSNAQATDLANFYLGNYNAPKVSISEIVCISERQNSWNLDLSMGWWDIVGQRTNVIFRGTTYVMTILGCSMSATAAGSVFTYYVADSSLTPFFILDDPNFGILDTNKLSW